MAQLVTQQTFKQEVIQSSQAVLVDFYADWCGPCRMVGPILEEVAQERADIKLVKVNVDQEPGLASQHGVMSIPTLILYKDGNVLANWVGLRPKPVLLRDIAAALNKM